MRISMQKIFEKPDMIKKSEIPEKRLFVVFRSLHRIWIERLLAGNLHALPKKIERGLKQYKSPIENQEPHRWMSKIFKKSTEN